MLQSAERPGWIYGMLADGFSGFFPVICAEISSSDIETELWTSDSAELD